MMYLIRLSYFNNLYHVVTRHEKSEIKQILTSQEIILNAVILLISQFTTSIAINLKYKLKIILHINVIFKILKIRGNIVKVLFKKMEFYQHKICVNNGN